MISIISGTIVSKDGNVLTVLTPGGVGYEIMVNISSARNWEVGASVRVLTHLAVREGAMELYGFSSEKEKEFFGKLLLVNGIGPKTAMHLLSLGNVEEISSAIARGDLDYLTNVSGIGKKTAERIVVELKSKIINPKSEINGGDGAQVADVIEGLMALGYSAQEAREAIKKLETNNKTSEQLLKEALQRVK